MGKLVNNLLPTLILPTSGCHFAPSFLALLRAPSLPHFISFLLGLLSRELKNCPVFKFRDDKDL